MSTAATPRKRTPSTIEPQIERERLFSEVILAYRRRKPSQPLVGCDPDPTGSRKGRTAQDADFIKDVESATRFALQGSGLFPEWQRLAKDDVWQIPRVMQQIIGRCARVYQERGLAPNCYFRREKNFRTHYPHGSLGTKWFCERHDLQATTECFRDAAGKIVRLHCGCERREDILAEVPVRGTVVSIDAGRRATASHSVRDGVSMPEFIGTTA